MTPNNRRQNHYDSDNSSKYALNSSALDAADTMRGAGFAVHWLWPKEKRPIGERWSEASVATFADLRASYRPGNNVGVRLGEPSKVDSGGYLHAIDMDIRTSEAAEEAWAALRTLLPGINLNDMPCVQSGSGGESRHLYFITDKPFRSKRLWTSEGKHRNAKGGWSYDAEIELFGTGKQVACPPSIHPDSGKPYIWLREFDFVSLDMGFGPFVPSAEIERLAVAEHTKFEFETRDPLDFKAGQFERILTDIPVSDLHYDDWIKLGQAIHHQTGGSEAGFNLWLEHTKRSTKFTGDKQVREMRRVKWRSFGRYRGQPVTMASVVEWAKDARVARYRDDAFDEEDEDEGVGESVVPVANAAAVTPLPGPAANSVATVDPFDLIGEVSDAAVDEVTDAAADAIDMASLLGGEDNEDAIDAIGANRVVKGQSRAVSGDWISLLDVNDEGAIKPTLHNVELIVRNDPRLVSLPQRNEFTQETVQRRLPGAKQNRRRNAAKETRQLQGPVWAVKDKVNGDIWSSSRDFAIRSILEAPSSQGGYGIKITDRDLKAATVLAAWENKFHPVQEYLSSLVWDGVQRVERLFIDYLGTDDNHYYRDVARLMMVAAVARVFEPGCKWDTAIILEGAQGRGKSTFIRTLGRRWFSELDGKFHDSKDMVEKLQGSWILEMPELNGFARSEVQSIKAFVSRQVDKVRLAYEARAADFPRQSILIGSSNDFTYLRDSTGGRRFLPVRCNVEMIDNAALRVAIDQLWAEAYRIYHAMRSEQAEDDLPLYLIHPEAQRIALQLQESARIESPDDILAGRIEAWLQAPKNSGSIDDDLGANGQPIYWDEVCTQQVWVECLGGDKNAFKAAEQTTVNRAMGLIRGWGQNGNQKRFAGYGKQRVWYRGGQAGKWERMGLAKAA